MEDKNTRTVDVVSEDELLLAILLMQLEPERQKEILAKTKQFKLADHQLL